MRGDGYDDGFRVEDRVGHLTFSRPAKDVVLIGFHGGLTEASMPKVFAALEEVGRERGTYKMFVDAENLTSYTPEFRRVWTDWLRAHRGELEVLEALLRSAIARMGLSIVNPLVGNFIKGYSGRAEFEKALAAAINGG